MLLFLITVFFPPIPLSTFSTPHSFPSVGLAVSLSAFCFPVRRSAFRAASSIRPARQTLSSSHWNLFASCPRQSDEQGFRCFLGYKSRRGKNETQFINAFKLLLQLLVCINRKTSRSDRQFASWLNTILQVVFDDVIDIVDDLHWLTSIISALK